MDKKRKVEDKAVVLRPSKIFSPFRVIGNVSNDTPFALGTLGSTFYVVTSVGRAFQIYDVATLHLLFISQEQTESKITCLFAQFHYVYAAFSNKIGIYKRGRLEHTLVCETKSTISHVLVFGSYLIAAAADGEIFIFKKRPGEKYATEFYTSLKNINTEIDGVIVGLLHPPTYLNKIVVATTGGLFIFNIRTGKLLFKSPDQHFTGSSISCIEAAPVLDIIAVGTTTGEVILYHIKKGKVMGPKIITDSNAKIVSLSFRTDGCPHFVAAMSNGDLHFYDLHRRTRVHVLRNAHREMHGGVANAKFLNGQPIVVTNGGDNNLKEYVFDPTLSTSNSAVVSSPRHLRSRGGHSAPPLTIEFPHEDKSHFIYSASRDRSFWQFSLRKDAQAQELSQRPPKTKERQAGPTMRERVPEIFAICSSQVREGEWENIITAHEDEPFARTWDSRSKRIGRHNLNTVDTGLVKAVGISHCGNFGFVGSSLGGIGVYNLQSGLLRKKYMLHKKAVTGVAIDGMNRKMLSCGLDGIVGFYDFSESKYLGKLQLEAPITLMTFHKSSELAAMALDDLSIVIIDTNTQKVVRILYGHSNRITSLDFSPDGRWIVSTALDATLRTWDIPTGGCIDGVLLPNVATQVKFSPLGDYLATTHVSGNGIFLWTNRAQFKPVSTRHVEEEEFATIMMPNVSGYGGASMIEGALEESIAEINLNSYTSTEQIDPSLITLSSQARTKFSTLLHLETVKERNKAKETAENKPERAPFFLSLTGEAVGDRASGAEGRVYNHKPEENSEGDEEATKLQKLRSGNGHAFESKFTQLLREGGVAGDYTEFLAFLINASPSVVDLEVRSLNSFPPLDEMTNFVSALNQGMTSKKNYDLYHAIFAMFLKNHGDVLHNFKEEKNLQDSLDKWRELTSSADNEMDSLVKYCSGVINSLSTV